MLTEISQIPAAPQLPRSSEARAVTDNKGLADTNGQQAESKKLGGLVLTRHPGESIMVGDDVQLEVIGIKSGTVRIKIVAPRSIPVHRREVFEAIQSSSEPGRVAPSSVNRDDRPAKPGGGLVLTRSTLQSIMIGDDVEVTIVEIRPTTAKLKISAPKSVKVHRREVYDAIRSGQD